MSQAIQEPAANDSITAMLQRSVLFNVTVGKFGNTKKVNSGLVEVDADKSLIQVNKSLLDSPEAKAINSLDSDIRQYLYSRSLPSPFRNGLYMMPIALVSEVEEQMGNFQTRRLALVDQFISAYDERVADARDRLRSTFNPSDYPPMDVVRRQFTLDWAYLSLTAPANLPPSLFQREQEKIASQWQDALSEARGVLRTAMAEMVKHAAERLSGGQDGKPKVFRNTLLENLNDFLGTFDARNLTDDGELSAMVAKAKQLVEGVDPDTLRKDETVRERVAAGFQEIESQLNGMMVSKPKRAFFQDDEAAA